MAMRFQLIDKEPCIPVHSPAELKTSPDGHLFIRDPTTRIARVGDKAISVREGASDQFAPLSRTEVLIIEKNLRVATLWRERGRELTRRILETETIRRVEPDVLAISLLNLVLLALFIGFAWLPLRISPATAAYQPFLDFTLGLWILGSCLLIAAASHKVGSLTGAAARTRTAFYLGRRDGVVAIGASGAIVADCKLDGAVQDIRTVSDEKGRTPGVAVRTKHSLYLLHADLQVAWRHPLAFNAWCPQTLLSRHWPGSRGEPCLVVCDGQAIHWFSLGGQAMTRLELPRHLHVRPTFGVADFGGNGTEQVAVCVGKSPFHARPLLLYDRAKLVAQSEPLGRTYLIPQIRVGDVNGDGHPEVVLFQDAWMKVFAVR